MSRSTKTRQVLVEREGVLTQELRRLAPEVFAEYCELRKALNEIDSDSFTPGPYTGLGAPMTAVDFWLDNHHYAAPRGVIALEIAEGGFRAGESLSVMEVKKLILDSMRNQLLNKRYVEKNGKMGYYDWPNEHFV